MSTSVQLVGIFKHVDGLEEAVRSAQEAGIRVRDVYSPVPVEPVLQLVHPKRSPVRFATFLGGVLGLTGGLVLAVGTALIWDIIVFGKPVAHLAPFLVIGFEGTILLGGIFTLLALLGFSDLPELGYPTRAYQPEFSNDRFGLWLSCPSARAEQALAILEGAGAERVRDLASEEGI